MLFVQKGAICCAALPHNFTRRWLVRPGAGVVLHHRHLAETPPPLCTIIFGSTPKKRYVRFVPNPLSFLFIKIMLSRKASVQPLYIAGNAPIVLPERSACFHSYRYLLNSSKNNVDSDRQQAMVSEILGSKYT